MDERPTLELVLPDSQAKVILFSYLRNGDFKVLERKLVKTAQVKIDPEKTGTEALSFGEIDMDSMFDRQELLVKLMIKEVFDKSGQSIADSDAQKDEFIYNLTRPDGKTLEEKVKELTTESVLSPEQIKK